MTPMQDPIRDARAAAAAFPDAPLAMPVQDMRPAPLLASGWTAFWRRLFKRGGAIRH